MSKPIDVLAVIAREARLAYHFRVESDAPTLAEEARADAEEARAALAELIEADSDYQVLLASMRSHPAGHTQKALNRAEKRCAVALARVKGGVA
ncbi:hypothetical protein ACTUVK_000501 [Stenotrophomonas rhizophila]